MTNADDEDDVRLGRCPRCRGVRPVRMRDEAPWLHPAEEEDGDGEGFVILRRCFVCGLGGVPRSSIRGGYFRRDLMEAADEPPRMGKPCFHCGARIPRFLDLDHEDHERIYRQSRTEGETAAVASLVALMGCPREWARIWVTHPFGPRRPLRLWAG